MKRMGQVVRMAVDRAERPRHAMLTLHNRGALRVWQYEVGSATNATRYYSLPDGTPELLVTPHMTRVNRNISLDAAAARPSKDNAMEVCLGEAAGAETDVDQPSPRIDATYAQAALGDIFHITRATYLETDSGQEAEKVVALEFDAAQSLQLAFTKRGKRSTEEDVTNSPVDLTLAGDCGPVRRSLMTVFTLKASTPQMQTGRTSLLTILLLLGGEHDIHTAVGARLRHQLQLALRATYNIPSFRGDCDCAGARTMVLRLPYSLLLCWDITMLSHLLALTGGGDHFGARTGGHAVHRSS